MFHVTFFFLFSRFCVSHLARGLVPGEDGFLLGYDDLLLCGQVLEGEDVAPVEVALARQRAVVDVGLLRVGVGALQPTGKDGDTGYRKLL